MTTMTLAKALYAGLRKAMERDPKVVLFGEDIGRLGGVFRITDGLQKDFGEHRVIDAPLAESGIVGVAVGLAMRGYRPVVEIQFDGFVYPAFDQIVSQVAKMHRRSEGATLMPIVIRIPFGGGIGAVEHHSESPEAYFAHTAGLRVLAPSDPASPGRRHGHPRRPCPAVPVRPHLRTDDARHLAAHRRDLRDCGQTFGRGSVRPHRGRCVGLVRGAVGVRR